MANNAFGPSPIEKHILLLKLTELMENRPDFGLKYNGAPDSAQRLWISRTRGVVQRLNPGTIAKFDAIVQTSVQYWVPAIQNLQSHIFDIIEAFKVDLEIDGRAEVGSAYKPGDIYKFFADLRKIIKSANKDIFVVDPYFNDEAFDDYLSDVVTDVSIRVFVKKSPTNLASYVKKHGAQFSTKISIRSSPKLHDRIVFTDADACWVMEGSIKDGGKAPTYLIPLTPAISIDKLEIYEDLWLNANILI
jgi:hypothetical protein